MNMFFDRELAQGYKSGSQKVRVMSEAWVGSNIYCPCCGNPHIEKMRNNKPVSDFQCSNCGEIFELKSKNGRDSKKIADGAYKTMIERITSTMNPDFFVLRYSSVFEVTDLLLIPKFFFTPGIIEKRKPLQPTARRASWIGCNILLSEIPNSGKIEIIKDRYLLDASLVVEKYKEISKLRISSIENRGWLFDVLNCIESIENSEFTLQEVYTFVEILQKKHISNHNIEAKIRQQLQLLRDKGFISFLGKGRYLKLF